MPLISLPASIRQTSIGPGYIVLDVQHPAVHARIAPHGAHLMEWVPTGRDAMLYLSPQAEFREGRPIRGGVPVCWPWFGPDESGRGLPSHGFARSRLWQLAGASENDAGVTLQFTLRDDAETRSLWPHAFELELQMNLGKELHLALRMMNTGEAPFTVTGALHSYLAVGDIQRVTVRGLDDAEYRDTTGPHVVRRQEGDLTFTGEVDRDYHAVSAVEVHDAALDRTITVRGSGNQSTVVWNPWIEKAKALKDLPDDDYLRFVCLETANVWRDVITVAPGGAHELATTIRVD